MNTMEQSQKYISDRMEWKLEDVQAINEFTWVARATTTHLAKSGEEEHTFAVIACGYQHMTFDLGACTPLAEWCLRND